MRRDELHFDLPERLIAQTPAEPRDSCRLMVLDPQTRSLAHHRFFELGSFLRPGDVLVFNQSKVLPARLMARTSAGGQREVLLLREENNGVWQCLIGGRVKIGQILSFAAYLHDNRTFELSGEVLKTDGATRRIRFNAVGQQLLAAINQLGTAPTPPYIKTITRNNSDYQTVYANDPGSAAAPTAGLHFTQPLIDSLRAQGVQTEFLTLHVGLGTFQPVKTARVEDHTMHHEWFSVAGDTYQRIKQAKSEGRRIIAVGTTSVRVLESLAQHSPATSEPIVGETNIFILPGYSFSMVDALITNFHTPYSTLLALVYALGGTEFIRDAYTQAVQQEYRFFSFGDAMFITAKSA